MQRLGLYNGMSKNDEAFEMWKEEGACKMDRQNKKCSYTGKSGTRKNNAGTDKEKEKKLAGPLAKKELPAEGCCRRRVNRKKV